ncbi:MAG: DUF3343 domain-containing protein [Nitrospirae bacterium]|nr:DUF3343 domain-containing protein [Nitrospirota bacterium]
MPDDFKIIVFKTTYLTFKAERALKKAGIAYKIVTKPRDISSDCGLAVRVDAADLEVVTALMNDGGIEFIGVW